jgi:hypothetical protein
MTSLKATLVVCVDSLYDSSGDDLEGRMVSYSAKESKQRMRGPHVIVWSPEITFVLLIFSSRVLRETEVVSSTTSKSIMTCPS